MSKVELFWQLVEAKPRRIPRPSERNLLIYEAVRTAGEPQNEVAERCGLTQQRVSQIVSQVERWRMPEMPPALLVDEARAAVEERLERRRSEGVFQKSLREFDRSCLPLETLRTGQGRRGEWWERTVRQRKADLRLLKTANRANRDLGVWKDRPIANSDLNWALQEVMAVELLTQLRHAAEREGRVPPAGPPRQVVLQLLRTLTGEDHHVADGTKEGKNVKDHCSAIRQNKAGASRVTHCGDAVSDCSETVCSDTSQRKPADEDAPPDLQKT